jgi:hypothetical protein
VILSPHCIKSKAALNSHAPEGNVEALAEGFAGKKIGLARGKVTPFGNVLAASPPTH